MISSEERLRTRRKAISSTGTCTHSLSGFANERFWPPTVVR